jgi:hypothetical protein
MKILLPIKVLLNALLLPHVVAEVYVAKRNPFGCV